MKTRFPGGKCSTVPAASAGTGYERSLMSKGHYEPDQSNFSRVAWMEDAFTAAGPRETREQEWRVVTISNSFRKLMWVYDGKEGKTEESGGSHCHQEKCCFLNGRSDDMFICLWEWFRREGKKSRCCRKEGEEMLEHTLKQREGAGRREQVGSGLI